MSDLAQLLRGYRIDARQPEEVMRQAADELDRLNAQALELCAEISGLRRENERLRSDAEAMRHDLAVLRGFHHEGCMAEIERLRGLLRECEPAVYSQHMVAIGTRIAKPPTLLARVRATLAGAYAASITVPTTAAHVHKFTMSFQTGDLRCQCGATPNQQKEAP